MEKFYNRINWQNKPNLATPIGATNLNKMDSALEELDNRTLELNRKNNTYDRVLNDLQTESNEHTQNIVNLQTQTESITQNIDSFKIVSTASGSPVYIDDSSNMNFEGIDFYGESKQETTTGKNLLDCSGLTEKTVSGVKFAPVFENGMLQYISVGGTAEENIYYTINNTFSVDEDSKYILNGCPLGGASNTYCLAYYEWNDSWSQKVRNIDGGNGIVLNHSSESSIYQVRIVIAKGTSCNNLVFKPMIRLASITDSTYEPYTGGKSSPNPDYPQPIESKVVNRVDVYGKNLLPFPYYSAFPYTTQGVTFTSDEKGVVNVNGTSTGDAFIDLYLNANKMLTTEPIIFSKGESGNVSLLYFERIGGKWVQKNDINTEVTITPSEDATGQIFRITLKSGKTANNEKCYPMIRLATITDATYEPYQSQTVNLSAQIELNGIGDVKDTEKLKKFGVVVFDGSDDEYWYKENNYFKISIPNTVVGTNLLCTHLQQTKEYAVVNSKSGVIYINSSGFSVNLSEVCNTVGEFRVWLASNLMTVVYELATPIETSLPQVDIDAIKNLHTYKPNTAVRNDADAEMDVSYVADTKLYIDKKFRELASAIVNQ